MARPERLRRRADFRHAARGKRFHGRGFTLQAAPRRSPPQAEAAGEHAAQAGPRFGFLVTKKAGGAVRRNRIRRRLKEALRLIKPLPALPGYDYVIRARPEALRMTFQSLQAELLRALKGAGSRESSSCVRNEENGRTADGPARRGA